MIIYKDFEFHMAHRLSGYKGDCSSIHGHSYKMTIGVNFDELNSLGMGIDFKDLKEKVNNLVIKDTDHALWLKEDMENKDLIFLLTAKGQKLVITPFNPTAENMALVFWSTLKNELPLYTITLYETQTSRVTINKANFEFMAPTLKTKVKQENLKKW